MKIVLVLISAIIFMVACSKDPVNPPVDVVVVPSEPDTLSAGWTKVGSIPVETTVTDIFFTDPLNGYITAGNGLYRSQNSGIDWVKFSDSGCVNIAARGNKACFVNTKSTMFHTQNRGLSVQYTSYLTATADGGPAFKDCFFSTDNVCFAASNKYIWKSTNGGITFDSLLSFVDGPSSPCLFFVDDQVGWISRARNLYKTEDAGLTWNIKKSLADDYAPISFYNRNNGFVADGNILYNTTNAGGNWQQVYTFPSPVNDIHFFDANNGYCCSNTSIYKTTDGGLSWSTVVALGRKLIYEIHFTDDRHGWACGQYGYVLRFSL